MRFKTLFAVCALFGSLFQSSPSLSETLRTAWLGEHEAFLTWYAKEKGWDKEAGLDIIMLRVRFRQEPHRKRQGLRLAIAGWRGGSSHAATMSDQVEVIAIANDESSANMILTAPTADPCGKGIQSRFPECLRDARIRQGQAHPVPQKNVGPLSARQMGSPRSGLRRRTSRSRNWNRHPPSARSRTGTAISSPSGRRSPARPKRSGSKLRRIRRIAVQRSRAPCRGSRVHGKESGRRACVFESLPAGCG